MNNSLVTTEPKNALSKLLNRSDVMEKFIGVLGEKRAKPFVQSVLITVSANQDLMNCSHESIYRAALRAATLELSCDPAMKQAWIIPYDKNVGTYDDPKWVKEAQFQPHYMGLYNLAMRTGRYWHINVSPVYDGERVYEDAVTGRIVVKQESGLLTKPEASNPAYTNLRDITSRRKKEMKVIGWIGYFKMKKGEEKYVYKSCVEIDDHARQYVKGYLDKKGEIKNPNWKDPDKRVTMEMKTTLRELLNWTDKSGEQNPADKKLQEALEYDSNPENFDEPITVASESVTEIHDMTIEEARDTRIQTPIGEVILGEIHTIEQLNAIYLDDNSSDVVKRATALVLKTDWSVEPPDAPKKSIQDLKSQMGF